MAKPDFKVDGRVNLMLRSQDQYRDTKLAKEAVVQIESKRRAGVKAAVDVRGSDDSRGFELREVFLDYKNDEDHRLVVGRAKKRFGLQWDHNLEEVLALTRGLVYRKLTTLGFTGRDATLSYQIGDQDEPGLSHQLSLHSSEGLNASLLYRYTRRYDGDALFASYTLLQIETINSDRWAGGAQSFAYTDTFGDLRAEAELYVGVDAFESQYRSSVARASVPKVWFSGATLGASYGQWDLQPFLQLSALAEDLSELSRSSVELAFGARYYFQPRFYAGFEARLVESRRLSITALDTASQALIALRYFF